MNRTPCLWRHRHALATAVVAAAVMSTACSVMEGGKKDSTSPAGGTSVGSDTGAPKARTVVGVPRLPARIEMLISTPEVFITLVDGLTWTGHIVERQCDDSNCSHAQGGNKSTVVRHEAVAGANGLAFDTIPANGVVVGRMRNLGQHKEAFYDLPPNKGEWYVILTPRSTNTATLRLVNLDYRGGNGKPTLELMNNSWVASKCNDGHSGPLPSADAGFKDCLGVSPLVPNSFSRGAWFTCSLGCCTTDSGRPVGDSTTTVDSGKPTPRPN